MKRSRNVKRRVQTNATDKRKQANPIMHQTSKNQTPKRQKGEIPAHYAENKILGILTV